MTDIPKEIMDEARRIARHAAEPQTGLYYQLSKRISRALMARDERAAEIVQGYDPIFSATNSMLDDAADAILTYKDAG